MRESNSPSLQADLTYLRKLAEAGRKGPILGGMFLAAAGIIFGIACAIAWAGVMGYLPLSGWQHLYLWLGAFAVFGVVWLLLTVRMRASGTDAHGTATSAMFGTIWGCCGAGVMVTFLATEIVYWHLQTPIVQAGYVPTIFAFYGTAWIATGALAKRGWMMGAGLMSFVFTLLLAFLAGSPYQLLVMACGLALLLTWPGLMLVAREAKAS